MNFLFWNIHKKGSFVKVIQDIIREEDIDIVAFAEFPKGQELAFETEFQNVSKTFRYLVPYKNSKIEIFYKEGIVNVTNALVEERISANKIFSTVDKKTYLLVFCHSWSKLFLEPKQQYHLIPDIVEEIVKFEKESECENTIVCGDFNMDAYEDGMLLHKGFNAMMTSDIAMKRTRKVNKRNYSMFYNPMWSLYGDLQGSNVSGTYYYTSEKPIHKYWHMLDQVIIRPDVIPVFDKKALKIISKGNTYNLLNSKGVINKRMYSDHLPIKFKLSI